MGWCIADNESNNSVESVMNSMKMQSPATTVRVIMTDDGNYTHKLCYCSRLAIFYEFLM